MRTSAAARPARTGLVALTLALATACGSTVGVTADQAAEPESAGLAAPTGTPSGAPVGAGSAVAPGSTSSSAQAAGAAAAPGQGAAPAAGTTTAQGGRRPASGASAAAPVAGGDRQGLTATTIKVGFIGLDASGQAETNAAFGATTPPANTQDATKAVVAYVNSHGGIDGRKIIPYYVARNSASQDPNQMDSICAKMTEDDHVFAVVTNYTSGSEPCYVKHHTLLLNDDNIDGKPAETTWNPYVWSPGLVTSEGLYAALMDSLIARGYFSGGVKLGILSYDDAMTKYVYETSVQPRLAALHVQPEIFYIGYNDTTEQFAKDTQAAELRFKADGVNHVMFMAGGGGAPLIFMNTAETQRYHPRYALTTSDSPAFLLQGKAPNDQLHNSIGAGVSELTDVDATRGDPYPTGPGEQQCYQVLKAAGQPPQSRATAFGAEFICDGAFMLQAAARGLGAALSIQTWAGQAERLGRTFQAAYSLPDGTDFVPGSRAGQDVYRYLAFIDSCECFKYTSGNRQIP